MYVYSDTVQSLVSETPTQTLGPDGSVCPDSFPTEGEKRGL